MSHHPPAATPAAEPVEGGWTPALTARAIQVKICGITRLDDARQALGAGADYLGLVFAESPRRLGLEAARRLVGETAGARWVGVFADAGPDDILRHARAAGLTRVQLHGREPRSAVALLREAGLEVWRAVGVDEPADWEMVERGLAELEGVAHLVLMDRRSGGRLGGGGVPFDWDGVPRSMARRLARTRLGLSGGLGPENVAQALRRVPAHLVDASSGLERAPGIKDPDRVRAFVRAAQVARARFAPGTGRSE